MIAEIEIEGEILKQDGNKIFCKIKKTPTLNILAHIWITKGETIEDFENNPAINKKAGLLVGANGSLKLY